LGRNGWHAFFGMTVIRLKFKFHIGKLFRLNFWSGKFDQSRNKFQMFSICDLSFGYFWWLYSRVLYFYERCGRHSRKSLVIKQVCCNFSNSWLAWFYTSSAGFTSEISLHSSRIIWSKWFFIDRFKNSDWTFVRFYDVCATSALFSQNRFEFVWKTLAYLINQGGYVLVCFQSAENFNFGEFRVVC